MNHGELKSNKFTEPYYMKEVQQHMIKSVVSKEYQELQKEIVLLQDKWKQQMNPETIKSNLDKAAMEAVCLLLHYRY